MMRRGQQQPGQKTRRHHLAADHACLIDPLSGNILSFRCALIFLSRCFSPRGFLSWLLELELTKTKTKGERR